MSNTTTEIVPQEQFSLAPVSAIESITRGEIDVQISTAHRFPRSMQNFKRRAIEMATLDEDTAASCLYSRPVGGGKFAEGLSVRTAEIVGACYGNLRVGAMIVEQTERYVTARGFAHDLESNFASACEVIESTVKRDGSPYDERMRVVIAKACLAKARRDATFQVVPKALCKPIEAAARAIALGDASTLAARRDGVMGWIGKLGIDAGRVFAALGILGADEIGLEQLATLTGLKTAIKDGEVTVDEAFPAIAAKAAESKLFKKETPALPAATTPVEVVKPKEAAKPKPKVEAPAPVSEVKEDQPSLIDVPAVSLPDQIRELVKTSGVKWSDALAVLKRNGITSGDFPAPDDADDETLSQAIHFWPSIVKLQKGGAR